MNNNKVIVRGRKKAIPKPISINQNFNNNQIIYSVTCYHPVTQNPHKTHIINNKPHTSKSLYPTITAVQTTHAKNTVNPTIYNPYKAVHEYLAINTSAHHNKNAKLWGGGVISTNWLIWTMNRNILRYIRSIRWRQG